MCLGGLKHVFGRSRTCVWEVPVSKSSRYTILNESLGHFPLSFQADTEIFD